MTGHDAALRLAATALDFGLSPSERAELDAHLAACATCAAEARAMRSDLTALSTVGVAPLDPRRANDLLAMALAPARSGIAPLRLALVAALVALLALGSLLVGATLLQRQRDEVSLVVPAPSPVASAAVAVPTPATSAGGQVAYATADCAADWMTDPSRLCTTTSWLAAADGSGARQLPGIPMGWSADGSRLLVEGEASVLLTDPSGSTRSTFPTTCSDKDGSCASATNVLCRFPCTMADGFALSPDGTRVAFVRGYANNGNATVIAILDVSSGRTTELTATRTTNPDPTVQCSKVRTCQGQDDTPRWSPDGRRIVFARQTMSPESGATWTSGAVYVVDADGSNLRRVTPTGLGAFDPSWSPDGTRLVFTNNTFVVDAKRTTVLTMKDDIYTIGLDGTRLTRLTDDGISARPDWTSDGRVAFMRRIGAAGGAEQAQGYQTWVMNADGADQLRLGPSLAELSAAGCTACIRPSSGSPAPVGPYRAYWQPTP